VTSVRDHLAVASAALALAIPFITIANAAGTASGREHTSTTVVGRQSRTSGVGIAGGSIYLWSSKYDSLPIGKRVSQGGACTLGYAVRSRATGRSGVLTAGHCVATLPGKPSYALHQTTNVGATHTDPGVLLAKIQRGQYRMGVNGDSAVGFLAKNASVRPYLFVGGTRSKLTIPVVGIRAPRYKMKICYSGATSGEHCGYRITDLPHGTRPFTDPNGGPSYKIGHEWGAKSGHCTSRPGDSGSPVYQRVDNQAYAVGILSGAYNKDQCEMFFTPIGLALDQLILSLVRAHGS
jgi:hypothetical protein